jgi:hypothetical protein
MAWFLLWVAWGTADRGRWDYLAACGVCRRQSGGIAHPATPALHLDGLADTWMTEAASGSFLRIMKDHAVRLSGAVGIVLTLLLKYGLILGMLQQDR